MPDPSPAEALRDALARVQDPELRRPITELGMVESVHVDDGGAATVRILLTIAGCPLRSTIVEDVRAAALLQEAVASGYRHIKLKVGRNLEEDRRRVRAFI